jgi:hypothetical protein
VRHRPVNTSPSGHCQCDLRRDQVEISPSTTRSYRFCDEIAEVLERRAQQLGAPATPDELIIRTRYGTPNNGDKFRQIVICPTLRADGMRESFRTATYGTRPPRCSLSSVKFLALAQRAGPCDPAIVLRVSLPVPDGRARR